MVSLKDRILHIVNDRVNGSSELLNQAISAIYRDRNNLTVAEVRWTFDMLSGMDKAMAIIHHFVDFMNPYLPESQGGIDEFVRQLEVYLKDWNNVEKRIHRNVKFNYPLSGKTILTHSRSSTILSLLSFLRPHGFRIYQTKSIPGEEGILQAEAFRKVGFQVELIDDDRVAHIIPNINICLLGCDQYSKDVFVNKVGTRRLVDAAREKNIPVLVFSDSRKYVSEITQFGEIFEQVPFQSHVVLVNEFEVRN